MCLIRVLRYYKIASYIINSQASVLCLLPFCESPFSLDDAFGVASSLAVLTDTGVCDSNVESAPDSEVSKENRNKVDDAIDEVAGEDFDKIVEGDDDDVDGLTFVDDFICWVVFADVVAVVMGTVDGVVTCKSVDWNIVEVDAVNVVDDLIVDVADEVIGVGIDVEIGDVVSAIVSDMTTKDVDTRIVVGAIDVFGDVVDDSFDDGNEVVLIGVNGTDVLKLGPQRAGPTSLTHVGVHSS